MFNTHKFCQYLLTRCPKVLLKSIPFNVHLCNICSVPYREVRSHLGMENNSITLAKEFLRKHKLTLRQRQASYKAAKQEWNEDMLKYQLGVCQGISRNITPYPCTQKISSITQLHKILISVVYKGYLLFLRLLNPIGCHKIDQNAF